MLFASRFIKTAGQGKAIRPALEALYVETPERAVAWRAGRFVVLAPDKVAGRIHATENQAVGWTSTGLPGRCRHAIFLFQTIAQTAPPR
jgi:hypothetical protein